MTIGERIFELLNQKNMSQKELSDITGINASVISDWKRKGTNPGSDKILKICSALDITPEELLGGTKSAGKENSYKDYYMVEKKSELGTIVQEYGNMNEAQRCRLRGYVDALMDLRKNPKKT